MPRLDEKKTIAELSVSTAKTGNWEQILTSAQMHKIRGSCKAQQVPLVRVSDECLLGKIYLLDQVTERVSTGGTLFFSFSPFSLFFVTLSSVLTDVTSPFFSLMLYSWEIGVVVFYLCNFISWKTCTSWYGWGTVMWHVPADVKLKKWELKQLKYQSE